MRYRFEQCLERGKIVRIAHDPVLVEKELAEAAADLASAERSLENGDDKWATVQAYYAIFHALRAPVLLLGYREKSHRCLRFAVEALLVDTGRIPRSVLTDLQQVMRAREGADYGAVYSSSSAGMAVDAARRVMARVQEVVNADV
ncbi:MAG: HEPN domain-containing protein [Methanospirillum sp.]|nr:HEPN domain-containing protein [Methanospirillum sp.]